MKVANVSATLDAVTGGGYAERTVQMSRHLNLVGVQTAILTLAIGMDANRLNRLSGIEVVALPCLSRRFYIPRFWLSKIRQVISDADIVHLMGHWSVLNALVYFYLRWFRKPYVVCPAGSLQKIGRSKRLKHAYNALIGKRIIGNANSCIAITRSEVTQFADYGIPNERVKVIPNGIDPQECTAVSTRVFRDRFGLGDAPFVLFVGRLNAIKGPDLLIEAFNGLEDIYSRYHLVIAGPDDGMLTQLKDLVSRYGLQERVHFVGYVGDELKSSAYRACDVLAIPSRKEAMSIVVLEAGVADKPVVLTDQCGFEEVEKIGGGYVVPASVEGLKDGMGKALSDPVRRQQMGKTLGEYVKGRLNWDVIVKEYLALYTQVLEG